jgi:transcriptional antiterminator NusG
MTYFVIQTKTRGELKYLHLAQPTIEDLHLRLVWPRRSLRIKKRGKWQNVLVPIFPGYLFLEVDSVEPDLYWKLRRLSGFIRFLKSNQDIQPMPEKDARILASLLHFGEIVEKSIADFDENNRIRIIEGPLKGLEGRITKVDRRKGRAKIRLDLYDEFYLVDFGFQSIEKADTKG